MDVCEPQPSTSYEPVATLVPAIPPLGDSDWEDEDEGDDPDYFDNGDDAGSDCSYDELDQDETSG